MPGDMITSLHALNPIPILADRLKVSNRLTVIFGVVMTAGLCFAAVALTRRWFFSKSNLDLDLPTSKEKNDREAIHRYSESLKLQERPAPEILLARSKAFLRLKDYKSALQDCEKALQVEHAHCKDELHFQLVRIYDSMGNREQANAHYTEALLSLRGQQHAIASHMEMLMFRAQIAFVQEDYLNAQIGCLEIETLCKDHPEYARQHCLALCLKAYAYLAQGEIKQAFRCANDAQSFDNASGKEVSQLWKDLQSPKQSGLRPAFLDEMSTV